MAGEISFSAALSASKGGAQAAGTASGTADLAGTEMIASVQNFTTEDSQAISVGGCDTVQALYVYNMDSTNTLTVSLNSTHTQVLSVLPPLKCALCWGVSTTLYAKAGASTVDGYIVVIET